MIATHSGSPAAAEKDWHHLSRSMGVKTVYPMWDSLADGISGVASSTINSEARPLHPPLPPLTLLRSFDMCLPNDRISNFKFCMPRHNRA
ncbi:hypothetical protein Nepgr_032566 [Nepenthes gracilis]|uniref:Uncharacterized protein n=1 Tax=Nepenthes gracilis TaxID=150966 RepID=A0AAD3TIV9_NEPGR|nr:hypothetical protein Nepgr_032566 [Nepenthes gracilis]